MSLSPRDEYDDRRFVSKMGCACSTICICSPEPPSETRDALGVSSVTRKSKTFTGSADGGLGAGGGASVTAIALLKSGSGASSTYAFRGTRCVDSDIVTDFFAFDGFSLYNAP